MSQFDIAIFGATGLTGKEIVRHVYELSIDHPRFIPSDFQWAIAGRDANKLESIINEFSTQYPNATVVKPTIMIANVSSKDQLDALTKQAKVLINAVGPFRFMGEYVVRSCVENGCKYVDITGEPEFVERMQRTYHDKAVSNKTTIVHCCGFDSVPTDMGVLYSKNLYTEHGWVPNQVEMFLRIHAGPAGFRGGFATYESAVHGVGSVELLREIRKASTLKKLPYPEGQKIKFHKGIHYDSELGYHVPFAFADPSIVRLSQQIFLTGLVNTDKPAPPPVQFAGYLLLPSLWDAILYVFYAFVFSLLAEQVWGRKLLLEYPEFFSAGLFSRKHPTEDQLKQSSFEFILRSKGYDHALTPGYNVPPNRSFKVVVRGPEAGYVATPRIVIQCALTLLDETKLIPNGVLTPSTAFYNTDLIERLSYVGIQCLTTESSKN